MELPWLRTVQERAAKPSTSKLTDQQIAEATSAAPQTGSPEAAEQQQPTRQPQVQEPPPQQAPQRTPPEPIAFPTQPREIRAAQQGQAQGPTQPTSQAEQPPQKEAPPHDEPPPPWVVDILEPTGAAPPQAQTYEPEELQHIMPWAYGTAETGQGTPATTGDQSLPPWLSDMTVQETLQSTPQQMPAEIPEAELEGIEPFAPPVEEEPHGAPASAAQEQVPQWLHSITAQNQPQAVEAQSEPEPLVQRMVHLSQVPLGTPSGALEERTQVREVPVQPPRPGAVEALADLIQPAAVDTTVRTVPAVAGARVAEATTRRGIRAWFLPDGLIYLVIIAALAVVLIIRPPFGEVSAPAVRDVQQLYSAIESVPSSKPVLVVYDWDATRSAEMSALAQALMRHLMSSARRLRFVTISTRPQGPGFAQQITDALVNDKTAGYSYQYGRDYEVLGYLPANEAGLTALINDFAGNLPRDYITNRRATEEPLLQGANVHALADFGLVIELASDESDLRLWVEQVGTRTNVPIVAAVPQALEPIARPYRSILRPGSSMEALQAAVSGPMAALQYERQLQQHGLSTTNTTLADRLNAQSVAQLLVAITIVAALVGLGTRRIMRR